MTCGVCNLYASALYRDACERCNTSRLHAAREFIRAAEPVRLMSRAGVRVTTSRPRSRLAHALVRLAEADARCVRLKMWPVERSTKRPPWFYGDERSNTR